MYKILLKGEMMGLSVPTECQPTQTNTLNALKVLEKGEPMVTREEVFDVLMEIQKHLIKCKDCKWCEKSGGILWCNIWHDDTNGLNFCSYAERRADGDI